LQRAIFKVCVLDYKRSISERNKTRLFTNQHPS